MLEREPLRRTEAGLLWRVRRAKSSDEGFALRCYEEAREGLARAGVDQWQDGYPNSRTFRRDLLEGGAFVLEAEDGGSLKSAGVFYFSREQDPDYEKPAYRGLWSADEPYAVLHRVALSERFKGRGLSGLVFSFAADEAMADGVSYIRIDTHPDNRAMRGALRDAGFEAKGQIVLDSMSDREPVTRIAFDAPVSKIKRR